MASSSNHNQNARKSTGKTTQAAKKGPNNAKILDSTTSFTSTQIKSPNQKALLSTPQPKRRRFANQRNSSTPNLNQARTSPIIVFQYVHPHRYGIGMK